MSDPIQLTPGSKQVRRGDAELCQATSPEIAVEIAEAMGARLSICVYIGDLRRTYLAAAQDERNKPEHRERMRHFAQAARLMETNIAAMMDRPDEAVPAGERARYNEEAGAMCPTDDVIAHLSLMRGDEKMFWRRCNQHPAYRPEAGL